MKYYIFEYTGNKIEISKLAKELRDCNVSLKSKSILVRWKHDKLGIVFDSMQNYRKFCGYEIKSDNLDIFTPHFIFN